MKGKEIIIGLVGRIFLSILTLSILLFFLDIPFDFTKSVNLILIVYISFYSLLLALLLTFPGIKPPLMLLLLLDIIFSLILIYSTGMIYSPFIFLLFLIPFSTSSLKWFWGIQANLFLFSIFVFLCIYYNRFTKSPPPLVDANFWYRFSGTASILNISFLLFSLLFIDFLLRRLQKLFSYSSLKKTLILSNVPTAIGFYKTNGTFIEASDFFIRSGFDNKLVSTLINEICSDLYVHSPKTTSFMQDNKNYELSIYPLNYSKNKTNELMILIKESMITASANIFDKFSLKEIMHEIKNPLAVISTAIHSIKENKEVFGVIANEIEQIKNFIKTIENREQEIEKSCELINVFNELKDIYRFQFEEKGIALDCFVPEGEIVPISKNHLKHILHNIFSNIVKYSISPSRVYVIGYVEYNIEDETKKFHLKFKNYTDETIVKNGNGLKIIRTILENYSGKLNFNIEKKLATTEIVI